MQYLLTQEELDTLKTEGAEETIQVAKKYLDEQTRWWAKLSDFVIQYFSSDSLINRTAFHTELSRWKKENPEPEMPEVLKS